MNMHDVFIVMMAVGISLALVGLIEVIEGKGKS